MAGGSKAMVSDMQLEELVSDCLDEFFGRKLEILRAFSLSEALQNRNPYSLAIDGNENASEIVEELLKAHANGYEEALFVETFFEPIARIASGGKVSDGEGVDFVVESDDQFLAVVLKSGQAFWAEITGDPDFYLKLARLTKDRSKKHGRNYGAVWDAALNRFTLEFIEGFCFPNGRVDWEKLVRFVSGDLRATLSSKSNGV